jgi:hypothetical protein
LFTPGEESYLAARIFSVLFTKWLVGKWNNVDPLYNSVQHFRLESNRSIKVYYLGGANLTKVARK